MPLINYEISLNLIWFAYYVICKGDRAATLAINSAKVHVPKVTLSTQDQTKLLQLLKSGFK